jgi:HPt (histidine-containing phosphotransfer) domain-containing protein
MGVAKPLSPSAHGLSPSGAAAFELLRERFVAGLPQRWQEIAASIGDPSAQLTALHRLAGAAGSYGLIELGQAARRAELSLEQGLATDLPEALAELQQLIVAASVTTS